MKTTTITTRDTEYSFIQTFIKPDGSFFSRKIEKGTVDYSNACLLFHMNDVAILIGNKVAK